jgi:hypothetical protein
MKTKLIIILMLLVSCGNISAAEEINRPGNPRGYSPDALLEVFKLTQADSDVAFEDIMQACPARDCIPSIDEPVFVSADSVDYLREDDLLLVLTHNNITRAYPTRILDRHEIVNDMFGSEPVAITYCPLCGSGLAFDRKHDGLVLDFGVSSLLHNSDLVMYDRQTESLWQQITGGAFAGKSRGSQLRSLPLAVVEWKDWNLKNPQAAVLTVADIKTDQYMKDAYGDYAESDRLYMPVTATDARLHPKRVIYAMEIGEQAIAIDGKWLAQQGIWLDDSNDQALVVTYGSDGHVTASLDGTPVVITRMFWFAWYSFHPQTALIDGKHE